MLGSAGRVMHIAQEGAGPSLEGAWCGSAAGVHTDRCHPLRHGNPAMVVVIEPQW